jgi:predicted acyltransferase
MIVESGGGNSFDDDGEDDPLLPQRQVCVRVSVTRKSQEIAQNTPLKSSRRLHSLSLRRILSLDIFRGLTMVGMILVDNQGDFNHVFWPLDESKWNGLRPSDTVFPSFIFIMGISIALIMPKWADLSRKQVWRIFRRVVVLFILGVYFNMQGSNFSSIFRIMGVLQRLSLTYGVAAFAHACLGVTLQRVLTGFLVFTYSMIMYVYDVPNPVAEIILASCFFASS